MDTTTHYICNMIADNVNEVFYKVVKVDNVKKNGIVHIKLLCTTILLA